MDRLRRNTRTSTINVKLNEKNEIECFNMDDNDVEEDDDVKPSVNIVDCPENEGDDDDEEVEDEEEDEDEDEEELIENPDGTLSIKIPELKIKKNVILLHHICAKCSKVLSSNAVS